MLQTKIIELVTTIYVRSASKRLPNPEEEEEVALTFATEETEEDRIDVFVINLKTIISCL